MLRLGARLAGPRCLLLCLLPAVLGAQPGWAGRPKPLPCQQVRLFPRAVASPALPTGAELGPSTHPAAQRRQVPNANPSARPQPASVSFCLPSLPTFVLPSALLPSSLFARGPSQPLPVLLCWWHLEQCPRLGALRGDHFGGRGRGCSGTVSAAPALSPMVLLGRTTRPRGFSLLSQQQAELFLPFCTVLVPAGWGSGCW